MTSESLFLSRPARLVAYAATMFLSLCASLPHAVAEDAAPAPRGTANGTAQTTGARAPRTKAAPKPAPNRANADSEAGNTAAYRALVEQALNEFKLENWPEARVLFRRAHEINPNARTLRGIGIVSYEMRDYVPALTALTAALADPRQPLTPAQRKECEELLTRTQTFIASYELMLHPAELELTVDGVAPVYDGSGRLLLGFGEHTLEGSAPGHDSASITITVQGGERDKLELALSVTAPEPPAVAKALQLAPAEQSVAAQAPLSSSPSLVRTGGLRYTWVALGASAVFGGAAAGTWFAGEKKLESLKQQCRDAAVAGSACAPGSVETGSVKRMERLTNAMLGVSAASLLTAAILLPIEWPRERQLAFDLSPRHVGLRGSF